MRVEDLDFEALLTAAGGMAVLFPAAVALVTVVVLRREALPVRLVGAFVGFVFPVIAIVGWFLYPKLRGKLGRIGEQMRDAGRRAQAAAEQAGATRSASGSKTQPVDLAKLLREAAAKPGTPTIFRPQASSAADPVVHAGTVAHAHAPLDPKRLLSPDLSVRFNTQLDGDRKLNIPKVVE